MKPRPHQKARLPQPVLLENRRSIGFTRTPVQDDSVKPFVTGLPTALDDVYRGLFGARMAK